MAQRFLIGVDSEEMPGRVKLTYLTLEEEIVKADDPTFQGRVFPTLDAGHPIVRAVKALFP